MTKKIGLNLGVAEFDPEEKPVVSICMIVKNAEDDLVRCLDSFLPIIARPMCELIIVDTGSTDHTLDVAYSYTDKVFHYEWNDDFSAARNFAISHASGKWIMTVDADEALKQESLYNLMAVFGMEDLEVNTMLLRIRNFGTQDRKQYSDMMHPRIFRNDGSFHYHGKIHNKPAGKPPHLFLKNVIFFHYGYMFDDEELLEKKSNRSLPLLQEAYSDDPNDLHTLLHLIKTHFSMHNWKEVVKLEKRWNKQMRKAKFHDGWYAYLEGFIDILSSHLFLGDTKSALRSQKETERYSKKITSIYLMLGNHCNSRDIEKAREYFEKAIDSSRQERSDYEKLLANDGRKGVAHAYNWLSIYWYSKGDLEKSGEYMNAGIMLSKNNEMQFRWDVWNDPLIQQVKEKKHEQNRKAG